MLCIQTSCLVSHTPNTKEKIQLFMFLSFLCETAVLAAAVLQISIRLFLFGSLVRGTFTTCDVLVHV